MKETYAEIKIHAEYKKIKEKIKDFTELSACRTIDFPNNLIEVCLANLNTYLNYYHKVIMDNNYKIKLDYILVTHITNYLSSVKAYLNRKRRAIEKKTFPKKYKDSILMIFVEYWKKDRDDSYIDKLIIIRNKYEHEKVSGISLKSYWYKDRVEKIVTIDNINITELFINSINELKQLDCEISAYIEIELSKIDLRHCVLFLNAFNKSKGEKKHSILLPEETEDEIKRYDEIICQLKQ